jgi:hypothetical protein
MNRVNISDTQDHGADPVGDGTFRMVPSGDIVDYAERCRRLARFDKPKSTPGGVFGLSWEEIAMRQGGLQTLDITRNKK